MIGLYLVGAIGLLAISGRSFYVLKVPEKRPNGTNGDDCLHAFVGCLILAFIAAEITYLVTGL